MDNSINKELLNAVIGNNFHTVKRLLENGANPNYFEDEAQIRPLHFAALYNFPDVIPLTDYGGSRFSGHYQIRQHTFNDCQTTRLHIGHQRTAPILWDVARPTRPSNKISNTFSGHMNLITFGIMEHYFFIVTY